MVGTCIGNTVVNFINDKIKIVDRGCMKYLILIASMMIAVPAMADNMDHETKAQAYVSCAFYGDMSVLGKKPDTYDIPSSEVDTFRKAALKEWRVMNKLNVINYSGDEEIINYVSRKYYHEMNCPLLLQTLK